MNFINYLVIISRMILKKRIYKAGGSIFKTNLDQFGMPFTIKESELGFKIPFRINPGRLAVSKYLII